MATEGQVKEYFRINCGTTGQGITHDMPVQPVPPFDENALVLNPDGSARRLKYERNVSTAVQNLIDALDRDEIAAELVADPNADSYALRVIQLQMLEPLSALGYAQASRDGDARNDLSKAQMKNEEAALQYLNGLIPASSRNAIEMHPLYKDYLAAPIDARAYLLYKVIIAVFSTGDASTRLRRMVELLTLKQGSMSMEDFVSQWLPRVRMFYSEHESKDPNHKGHVKIGSLLSSLFLAAINSTLYPVLYDNALSAVNEDEQALVAKFLTRAAVLRLTAGDLPSEQGADVFLASSFSAPAGKKSVTPAPAAPKKKQQGLFAVGCPFCIAAEPHSRKPFTGHDPAACSRNPLNKNKKVGGPSPFLAGSQPNHHDVFLAQAEASVAAELAAEYASILQMQQTYQQAYNSKVAATLAANFEA